MKAKIFILIFLTYSKLYANDIDIVSNSLETKNYSNFQNAYDSFVKYEQAISDKWGYRRQLTTNYFEEVRFIYIEKPITSKKNAKKNILYKISLVYFDNQIILFKLHKNYDRVIIRNFTEKFELVSSFQDSIQYKKMDNEFKDIFGLSIVYEDLFVRNYVFGTYCSFGGTETEGYKEIKKYVAKNDTSKIISWLKSTNTEKQLFGIVGLNKLKEKGYNPSLIEMNIMSFILNKKGTVQGCFGCKFQEAEILKAYKANSY